jgi:hypothetical protein
MDPLPLSSNPESEVSHKDVEEWIQADKEIVV